METNLIYDIESLQLNQNNIPSLRRSCSTILKGDTTVNTIHLILLFIDNIYLKLQLISHHSLKVAINTNL